MENEINFEKEALKILHHSKEGEYSSCLEKTDYFNWKKSILKRNEYILNDYATQVVYRYEFKKLAKALNEYIQKDGKEFSGCLKVQAKIIINICNKIEEICNNMADTEKLNDIMGELLDIFIPLTSLDRHNNVCDIEEFTPEETNIIKKNIALLNEFKPQEKEI